MPIPKFPQLTASSSTGKTKIWSIKVIDRSGVGVIVTKHGYEDGKMVENERLVTVGKNIGKSNETTPVEQAVKEAQSDWNKKKDAGYKDEEEDEEMATTVFTPPLPMLALDFNKRGDAIKFPCYAQEKLDGVRCLAIQGKGLYSRQGKKFPHMESIASESDALPPGTILDGELYSDTLTFQEIVGLVKKETLLPKDLPKMKHIFLWVYDTIREGSYTDRKKWLEDLFTKKFNHLRLLPTEECKDIEDVHRLHAKYVEEGYEGLILRNKAGPYKVGFRSKDLQKYKEFQDDEFTVIGFTEGDGIEKGCVIWTCETKDGIPFSVRPRGTHEERRELFKIAKSMVGKKLTVRFQEFTEESTSNSASASHKAEGGVPRFPVGIAFRDYE
jgi:DNA ligase-1